MHSETSGTRLTWMPSWLELTIYELSEISAGLGVEPLNGHYTFQSGAKMIDLDTLLAGLDLE